MNSLKGINEILKTHKEDLYKKYNVTEIGVFGSFVRGEHKKRSDITLVQNRILNAETQRTQRNQFFIWR
ncbi:MAG: nucleotidyltransferase family protein [bacterium]